MQKNSETLSLFDQTTYQESTSSLSDSLAKICHSLENEEDYKLTEAAYSLKQLKSLGLKDPNILSLKMSKGCSVVTEEKTSISYCERLPTLGTMVNGNLLILGGYSPKTERECRPKVFPICENGGENKEGRGREDISMVSNAPSREYGWKDVSPTLCARDYKDPKLVKVAVVGKDTQATRVYDSNGLSATLSSLGGGLGAKTGLYKVHCTQQRGAKRPSLTKKCDCGSCKLKKRCCGSDGGTGHLSRDDGNTYCLDTANSQAVEIRNPYNGYSSNEETGTLGTTCGTSTGKTAQHIYTETCIRRLTPMECELLQGFPYNWTEGQSDTQRYKQCGNAVSVPVVKAIMEKLYA